MRLEPRWTPDRLPAGRPPDCHNRTEVNATAARPLRACICNSGADTQLNEAELLYAISNGIRHWGQL